MTGFGDYPGLPNGRYFPASLACPGRLWIVLRGPTVTLHGEVRCGGDHRRMTT